MRRISEQVTWTVATWMLLGLAATTAMGAGLDRSTVPAEMGWLVHGDFDRLRQTEMGAYILDEMQTEEAERKFAAFKVMFAFDPRHDIHDVTLYGKGGGNGDGVAIFRGAFDTAQLITLLQANPAYAAEAYRTHTIHQWLDEKQDKITFGAVHADERVIVSDNIALVRSALDVLDRQVPSLASRNPFGSLLPDAPVSFMVAVADFEGMESLNPAAQTFRQAASGGLVIAEQAGQVTALLKLAARQQEAAEQMANVVRGILAFAVLGEQNNPESANLARRINVVSADGVVALELNAPAAEVVSFLKQQKRKSDKTVDDEMPMPTQP